MSTGLESFVEFTITVEDVNDNAPFLNMPEGLVWPENTPPGNNPSANNSRKNPRKKFLPKILQKNVMLFVSL